MAQWKGQFQAKNYQLYLGDPVAPLLRPKPLNDTSRENGYESVHARHPPPVSHTFLAAWGPGGVVTARAADFVVVCLFTAAETFTGGRGGSEQTSGHELYMMMEYMLAAQNRQHKIEHMIWKLKPKFPNNMLNYWYYLSIAHTNLKSAARSTFLIVIFIGKPLAAAVLSLLASTEPLRSVFLIPFSHLARKLSSWLCSVYRILRYRHPLRSPTSFSAIFAIDLQENTVWTLQFQVWSWKFFDPGM